jgi:hypothetical protein
VAYEASKPAADENSLLDGGCPTTGKSLRFIESSCQVLCGKFSSFVFRKIVIFWSYPASA